jgi:hypothetical protein
MTGQSSHAAARDSTTANSVSVNPTFASSAAIMYKKSAGRGGSAYNIYRSFYYFDTSGISGNVTDSSLNILGSAAETATVIIIPSTAFGGDGSADIVAGDYDNITFNATIGNINESWDDGLNNELEFADKDNAEGVANAAIRDQNYFICAVLEYGADYRNNEPGSTVTREAGINYATAAYLDYTEAAGSGYANKVLGVAAASIGEINSVAIANVGKVIGV